jgi:hypothetical protein
MDLPAEHAQRAKALAKRDRRTMSELFREAFKPEAHSLVPGGIGMAEDSYIRGGDSVCPGYVPLYFQLDTATARPPVLNCLP